MTDGQKKTDPGDMFRDSMRAVTGVIGAFKDAIEQTFNELSDRGDIAPDRARDAARDAMKRAQEAMDEMRDRVDFVSRKDFDALKAEIAELRAQVERHAGSGAHHTHGASGDAHAPGTASPGTTRGTSAGPTGGTTGGTTGAAGSGEGTGSPGV